MARNNTVAMRYEIRDNPVGIIEFQMDRGDVLNAEAASMVWMRGDIAIETKKRKGGLFKSLKTAVLSGESFFINEYTARADGCGLGITGNALGDLARITVDRQFYVQSGSYVCSTGSRFSDKCGRRVILSRFRILHEITILYLIKAYYKYH